MKQSSNKDVEIETATHLALVEIVVGSVGHGFKIPFTGTFLSFYQLYVCLWIGIQKKIQPVQVFNIAVIVALMKTLSPMGKKITPMIAISVQGFLLWLGSALFGGHLFGWAVGAVLFVSWSIIQQAIGYTILYGFDFFKMINFFQSEINGFVNLNVYFILFSWWVVKIGIAIGIVGYIYTHRNSNSVLLGERNLKKWQQQIVRPDDQNRISWSPAGRALLDLLNPFFLLSLILMVLFHYYQKTEFAYLIWFVCRTLAVGFLVFYFLRSKALKRRLIYFFGKNRHFRMLYKATRGIQQKLFG